MESDFKSKRKGWKEGHHMERARKRQRRDLSDDSEESTSGMICTGGTLEEDIETLFEEVHKKDSRFVPTSIRACPDWRKRGCEQAWMWPAPLYEYGCLRCGWHKQFVKWDNRLTIIATNIRYAGDLGFSEENTLDLTRKFGLRYFDNSDNELVQQSGVCPDVMLNVWKHPDFKGCMAEAVEKIERHHLKYFFVYCNQGTHRSVAMACLLNCLCYYNANVVVTTHRTRKDAFSIGWEEV